jgi:hypothetical protein
MHPKQGHRECPVLGKTIFAQECVAIRGLQHACPADCLYNPFTLANYDVHLAVEAGLSRKLRARAEAVLKGKDLESWRSAFSCGLHPDPLDPLDPKGIRAHCELMRLYHLKRDADGHSFSARWLLDPWANLSTDQRTLLRAMDQSRPVLIEVQGFLDEKTIEGIDLLTGRTLRILDRPAAREASRYMTFLGWSFPMAFYDRLTGPMEGIPDFGFMSALEVVREIALHLGGPSELEELTDWLAWNFSKVCEALAGASAVRLKQVRAAGYRLIKTDYSFPDRTGMEKLLGEQSGLCPASPQPGEEAAGFDRAWVVLEWAEEAKGRDPIFLGRMLIGGNRLRLEAMGERNHGAVRARVEGLAGLQFQAELAEDTAHRISHAMSAYDSALVPESLLEETDPLMVPAQLVWVGAGGSAASDGKVFRERCLRFPDESVLALGGLTPRVAAGIPEKRALLVALMKRHIRDVDRLRRGDGLDFDLNPLLEELGLFELVSTPPPLGGTAVTQIPEGGKKSGGEALSTAEIGARLNRMQSRYRDRRSAAASLRKRFPGFFEGLNEKLEEMLDPESMHLLEMSLVGLFFIMLPEGTPGDAPSINAVQDRLAEEIPSLISFFDAAGDMPEGAKLWIADSVEPRVLTAVSGMLLQTVARMDEEKQPSLEDVTVILSVLGSTLTELRGCSKE